MHTYWHINISEMPKYPSAATNIRVLKIVLHSFKDICGYFQCASFSRLETGKVVWALSFDH